MTSKSPVSLKGEDMHIRYLLLGWLMTGLLCTGPAVAADRAEAVPPLLESV